MSTGIFLVRDDQELVELTASAYDSEDLLQSLLERYPNLLAGDQIDSTAPRRWLLVKREAPVPADADGSARWSLDHLLLDQEGIPTLVEVKRSSDTRIRREVVGQMLDYAANGVVYWPVETVRAMYEARVRSEGHDPAGELVDRLGPELDPEAFWTAVKVNLQAGRIRLIFIADEIPPELRRVVEFLNNQMQFAEVLAIEVRQYVGGNFRGLVPRLLGQTEQGNRKKNSGTALGARTWDQATLLAEIEQRHGTAQAGVARRLIEWARSIGAQLVWGHGTKDGSVIVGSIVGTRPRWLFGIYTYGKVELQFQSLQNRPEFEPVDRRRELQRRLNAISGVSIADASLTKRPSFSLALLEGETAFQAFIDAISWAASVRGVTTE